MNDEKLIELVRKYSVLYDLSHPKYMNTDFKNIIWTKIAEEMETTGKKYNNNYFYLFYYFIINFNHPSSTFLHNFSY